MHSTDRNHIFRQWHWNIKRWIRIDKSDGRFLLQFRYRGAIRSKFFPLDFINFRVKYGCTMTIQNDKSILIQMLIRPTKNLLFQKLSRNLTLLKLTNIQWHEPKSSKIVATYSYPARSANNNVVHMSNIGGRQ